MKTVELSTTGSAPRTATLARALTDKQLRQSAIQLAMDAVVLTRTLEQAYARAERRRGAGKRKALVALAALGAVGLAVATKRVIHRG
jgi:glucose-6-phosphate dehydrogenase assembly protein OpcA